MNCQMILRHLVAVELDDGIGHLYLRHAAAFPSSRRRRCQAKPDRALTARSYVGQTGAGPAAHQPGTGRPVLQSAGRRRERRAPRHQTSRRRDPSIPARPPAVPAWLATPPAARLLLPTYRPGPPAHRRASSPARADHSGQDDPVRSWSAMRCPACSRVGARAGLLRPGLLRAGLPLASAFAECFTGHRAAPRCRPRSPMYSLSGLISRLSACCSMTCAVQPGHPAGREDRREQVRRNAQVVVDGGGEEVDVRVQALLGEHDLFHPARHPVIGVVTAAAASSADIRRRWVARGSSVL